MAERAHPFSNASGTIFCDHQSPVIEGYSAQCCEPASAAIHRPPFGVKYVPPTHFNASSVYDPEHWNPMEGGNQL